MRVFPPHHCDRIGIRGSTSAQRILHKTYAPKVVEMTSPSLRNNWLNSPQTTKPGLKGFLQLLVACPLVKNRPRYTVPIPSTTQRTATKRDDSQTHVLPPLVHDKLTQGGGKLLFLAVGVAQQQNPTQHHSHQNHFQSNSHFQLLPDISSPSLDWNDMNIYQCDIARESTHQFRDRP